MSLTWDQFKFCPRSYQVDLLWMVLTKRLAFCLQICQSDATAHTCTPFQFSLILEYLNLTILVPSSRVPTPIGSDRVQLLHRYTLHNMHPEQMHTSQCPCISPTNQSDQIPQIYTNIQGVYAIPRRDSHQQHQVITSNYCFSYLPDSLNTRRLWLKKY